MNITRQCYVSCFSYWRSLPTCFNSLEPRKINIAPARRTRVGRVVSRLETVPGCRSSSRGSQGRKILAGTSRAGQPQSPFSRCRCHIIVVDYRWGGMGSDETASTIPGGPRLILLIAGRRRVLERARQRNPVNPWPRGLGGRFWMLFDVRKRLHRTRGRIHRMDAAKSNSLSQTSGQSPSPPSFRSRALWRAPRNGACGVGDYPTPDLSRRESGSRSAPEKSVQFGPDGAPSPVKNVNYPRAPSSRRSGLVGPHTTPPIVNYEYMTSTL